MREVCDAGGAIFFSTHIISDIEKCADDIVYISGGRIIAALSKQAFVDKFSVCGETLEETFLRLERDNVHIDLARDSKHIDMERDNRHTDMERGGKNG